MSSVRQTGKRFAKQPMSRVRKGIQKANAGGTGSLEAVELTDQDGEVRINAEVVTSFAGCRVWLMTSWPMSVPVKQADLPAVSMVNLDTGVLVNPGLWWLELRSAQGELLAFTPREVLS